MNTLRALLRHPFVFLLPTLLLFSRLHSSFAAAAAAASSSSPSPMPVLLDTDIGDDFDDMMALTYLLSAPRLYTPLGVVASTRNTTKRALLVAHTLRLANRTDIPLYVGAEQADNHGNLQYESGWVPAGLTLAAYRAAGGVVYDACGVCALTDWLSDYSGPAIHYIEIAPASSLAAVLANQSALASKLTVFAMNGEVGVGYGNFSGQQVEWNVLVDIPASQSMYAHAPQYAPLDGSGGAAAPIVVSPLDSTVFQQWGGEVWKRFLAHNDSHHPLAAMLLDAYTHWYDAGGKNAGALLPYGPSIGTSTMYDAQAAYTAGHSVAAGAGAGDCSVRAPFLVSRCLCVRINDTGYVVEGGADKKQPCVNISVVVGLEGGRSDPYPAARRMGAVILSSIAGVDTMGGVEEGAVAVHASGKVEARAGTEIE